MKHPFILLLSVVCLTGCGPDANEQLAGQLLNNTLERNQGEVWGDNQRQLEAMQRTVTESGYRAPDVYIQRMADSLLHLAGSARALLDRMDGTLDRMAKEHPGNTGKVKQYLHGGSGEENDPVALLYRALRQYEFHLHNRLRITPSLPALPGSYALVDTVYRGSEAAFRRRFSHLTPREAQLFVAQLRAGLALNTTPGLESLYIKVGPGCRPMGSRIVLLASPKHSVVGADSLYEADLGLGSGPSKWRLTSARINGEPVSIAGRTSAIQKVSFIARNGAPQGSLKYWEGHFTYTHYDGRDTTLILSRPYRVFSRNSSLSLHTYHP